MPQELRLPLMLAPWPLGLMGWRYVWPRTRGYADLEAMQGLAKVSRRRANFALIGAGAVVIPLAPAEAAAAVLEPWAR